MGMRLTAAALLLLLASTWALAAEKNQDLILGKWEPATKKEVPSLEFQKDGKLKLTIQANSVNGTYKFLDDDNIEVTLTLEKQKFTEKLRIKVTKDLLTTVDSMGIEEKFKRGK